MNVDTFRQMLMVFVLVTSSLAIYSVTRPAETETVEVERILRVPEPVAVVERIEVFVTPTPAPIVTPEPTSEATTAIDLPVSSPATVTPTPPPGLVPTFAAAPTPTTCGPPGNDEAGRHIGNCKQKH